MWLRLNMKGINNKNNNICFLGWLLGCCVMQK
nr:MAG TPA: hypothetical protein [Caudoviricetes sp.]